MMYDGLIQTLKQQVRTVQAAQQAEDARLLTDKEKQLIARFQSTIMDKLRTQCGPTHLWVWVIHD